MAKTMTLETNISAYYMALFSLFFMFISLVAIDTNDTIIGFSVDLIHRDSPQSPIFDSSLSPLQRLTNTLQRSSNHAQHLKLKYSRKTPAANIINNNGVYLISYSIGTPPVPSFGLVDTGSDFIWMQCQPCVKCFKQKIPIFDPRTSYTFEKVPCVSVACYNAPDSFCDNLGGTCFYSEAFQDNSFTEGVVATETLTISSTEGESFPLPNIAFGCGSNNSGIFFESQSGIIGLGGGNYSLVGQLRNIIGGKFSYCLVSGLSSQTTSTLNFGSNAVVSGPGVVSTPLVPKYPPTFYYLTLDGISIENQRFDSSQFRREGNTIIDSGTTVSQLPYRLYNRIVGIATNMIRKKRARDPTNSLELCYYTEEDIQFPDIIFHFRGADVTLGVENTFTRIDDDVVCLAFKPTEGTALFGNLQQTNFLIGYDLEQNTVSFKSKDCSMP